MFVVGSEDSTIIPLRPSGVIDISGGDWEGELEIRKAGPYHPCLHGVNRRVGARLQYWATGDQRESEKLAVTGPNTSSADADSATRYEVTLPAAERQNRVTGRISLHQGSLEAAGEATITPDPNDPDRAAITGIAPGDSLVGRRDMRFDIFLINNRDKPGEVRITFEVPFRKPPSTEVIRVRQDHCFRWLANQ